MSTLKNRFEKGAQTLVVVILHVIAWALYLFFFWASFIQQSPSTEYKVIYVLTILVRDIPLFYYFYARAIPRLLASRRTWLFVFLTLGILLLYPLVSWCIDQLLDFFYAEVTTQFVTMSTTRFWMVFLVRASSALFVVAMAGMGKFTFDWFKNMRIRRELENQNLISELAYLKSQINPHFLFNTLNNIHTLAYKKADGAPEAIMKLSELMRYMLYESNTEQVPLETELQHLRSFIGLQELRFRSRKVVSLEVVGDVKQYMIAPLLLLPFVENAFKHGYQLNREAAIRIRLEVGDELIFETENEIAPKTVKVNKDEVGGIGLENISRRLELIYPGRYQLEAGANGNKFKAKLTLSNG